jgi:hypothetical protein
MTGIVAPRVLAGPNNGDVSEVYGEKVLTPTLKPVNIATMDNLSRRKRASVKLVIEAAGAIWARLLNRISGTLLAHSSNSSGYNVSKLFHKLKV